MRLLRLTPRAYALPLALATGLLVSCDAPTRAPTTGRLAPHFEFVTDPRSTAKLVALTGMRATLTAPGSSTIIAFEDLTPPATPTGGVWTGEIPRLEPGSYTLTLEGVAGGAIQHYSRTENITIVAGSTVERAFQVHPVVPSIPVFTLSDTTDFSRIVTLGTGFALATGWQYEVADNPAFTGATPGTATTTSFPVTVPDTGTWHIRVRPTLPFTSFSSVVWSDPQTFQVKPSQGGRSSASAIGDALGNGVPDTIVDRNLTNTLTEAWYVYPDVRVGDSLFATTRAAALVPASPLNTVLTFFRAGDLVTPISTNNDMPGGSTDSRDSIRAAVADDYYVRVTRTGGNAGHYDIILESRRLPAAPVNLTATALSGSGVRLIWDDEADNEASYRIERCTGAACTDFAERTAGAANDTTFVDSLLTPGETYRYRVRARNAIGNSLFAGPINVTLAGPNAPTALVATTVSGSRIDLTWNDASDNETGFEIQRCDLVTCVADGDFTFSTIVAADDEAYSNTGLAVDGRYTYRIRAINNVAPSAFSATALANTIRPQAPAGLLATTMSATRIDLAWDDSSAIETGFTIERCAGLGCSTFTTLTTVLTDVESHSDLTVHADSFYSYRVRATNVAGASSPSNTATANTRAPGVPASFTATIVSSTRVTISWSDTTAAETSFQLERCSDPGCVNFGPLVTLNAGATAHIDSTVIEGGTYRYRLRAVGVAGSSAEAGPVTAALLLPAAPTGLAATTVSGTEVSLSWTDASDNETTFRIERCQNVGCTLYAEIGTTTAGTAAFVDQTVTAGNDYQYRVRARNPVGNSVYTAIAAASTRGAAAPTTLSASLVSGTRIDLAWVDASDNETGFRIERCLGQGCANFALLINVPAGTQSYANVGLTAGNSYSYRVFASNAVGLSAASNVATATTGAPTAPSALSAVTISATRIDLTWTDESNDELGFRIERCDAQACEAFVEIGTAGANDVMFVDADVTAGNDYRYRVRAFNIIDNSDYTLPVSTDTRAPQIAPTISALTVSGTRIDLDWTDPNANELGFILYRCDDPGCGVFATFMLGANVTSFADTTVIVDREYTYQIAAYNNVGTGSVGNIVAANTLLPAAPSGLTAQTLSPTSVRLEWTNNALDANGFVVERCTGSACGDFAVIDSTSGAVTTLTDLTASQGNIYTYIVRARNIAGRSAASASVEASTVAPTAPSGLLAETRSDTRIDLTWVDGSNDETGFYIERCAGAGCVGFATVDSVTADVTSYVNLGLTPSLTYEFRVRAFSAAGPSAPSNTATASTNLPAIPTDFSATATTTTSVSLAWTDNATDEDGYSIERCDGAGCTVFAEIDQAASNATGYVDASVSAGQSYVYRIRAFNGAGSSDYSNTAATTTALPAAPSGLVAEATSTTSIELSWTDASDNESRFIIERCTGAGCGGFAAIDTVGAGTAVFTDLTVAAGTTYTYRVLAENSIGASPASNVAEASTILPAAPTNLSATTFSSSQVDLAWDDNAANETAYELERCTGVACLDFQRVDSLAANSTSYSDAGLTPNTAYRYRLRALNGAGASAYSAIADATTNVPADPTSLSAIASSDASITIEWTDNADNETDYVIQRCVLATCLDTDFSDLSVVGANVTTYVDGTVALGDTATYRVKAINLNGASRYSNNAMATVTIPAAPTGFTAANSSANQITLAWNDEAVNETGYEIERCTGAGCSDFVRIDSLAPGATGYVDVSSVLDQTYGYRVRTVNFVGVSAYTAPSTANTIRPAAPTGLSATTISATQVDLAWADNADNEQGYTIERCTGVACADFAPLTTTAPGVTTHNDLTTVVGQVYGYRIRGFNIAGTSSYDGPATASTLLPADPTALAAVVSAPTEITLTWADNAGNENGFRLERCSGSGCNAFVQIATISADSTRHVDTGLNSNTFYRYRLRAFNTAGVSAYTGIVSPNTFAPAQPTGLAATTVYDDRVDLTWTDPASNETGFRIERCTGAACSDFVEVAVVGANVTSHSDSTLAFNTTYRFRIRSYNGVANSAYTTPVEGNTNVPLAPTGLSAAAQSTTRIDLAWTDNGVNETGYRIERCAGVGCSDFTLLTTLPADATSHSDTPIAAATSFTYRVIAVNAGSSDPSNTATATTILPAAPTSLVATAVAGDRVDLVFADNADNEYGTIIERCDGAACVDFAAVDTVAADVTSYSDLGLTPGVAHRYRVRAYNGAGFSAYTSIAEAITNVPGIPTALTATTFDAGRIDLAWTDNAGDELGFVIERCAGAGCSDFAPIDSVESPDATAYSNTGLAAGTTYRYRVRAYNASGVSGASNTATAGTNVPATPTGFGGTVITANRIDLTWTDVADNEGNYVVERCVGAGCSDFAVIATLAIDAESHSDLTTAVNTTYRYRVRATNNAGASDYTTELEIDTDTPAAPTGLTATTISATRIDLAWTDASDNEGTFRIERCTGVGCSDFVEINTLLLNSQAYTDEPLTPNESYSYRVAAVNAAGSSPYTAIQTATTSIPADPTNLTATTVSANRIDLSWTDNSSNELQFVIERCADVSCSGGVQFGATVGPNVTSFSDVSASVGNLYVYRVRAENAAGISGHSVIGASTLLPNAPVTESVVITASDRITVTWMDASDNEDNFVVERCREADCTDFSPLVTLGAGVTQYEDTGLDLGVSYTYRVRAANAAGSSDPSGSLTTVLVTPETPSKLNATTLSATQIALDWLDNSSNETGFLIQVCRGAGCSDFELIDSVGTDVTARQIDDLEFDNSYTFRIIAVNPVGASGESDYATTTTSLAAQVTTLGATTVGPSQINLGWTDNSDNEQGFRIERCVGAGCSDFVEIALVGQDNTGYADAGLSLNTVYVYRVRPFNAVGPSGYSPEASANTLLPADPSNITATAITVNRIDLTWQDNANNENLYVVEGCLGAGCSSFSVLAVIGANSTSYSYTSATANAIQRLRVRAFRNNVGSSGYTTSGDVSTVLNAPANLRAQTVLRNRVDITWSDLTNLETGYQVLFCAGAGCTPATLAANLGPDVTSYSHTGLSQAQTYSWRIRAVSNGTVAASVAAAGAYTPITTGSGTTVSGITDTLNAERYYVINVPAGTPELRITMSGGTGEADLHVRYGAAPTRSVYDCRPFPIGNEESCIIPSPAAGDWYFMPHAYQAISGVSVKSSLSTRYGYPTAFVGTSSWSPNYLIGQQLFISQNITLTHLGLNVAGGTGGVRIGLYTNAGGIPGTLLAQVSGVIGTTGLLEFAAPNIAVAAGTYWVMYNFQNPITRTQDTGSPTTVNYINFTYGPGLPASYPSQPNGVFFPNGYFTYTGSLTNAHVRGYP